MPAAVSNMIDSLLQAGHMVLRDDRSLDQAYFAQLMLLFRVSVLVPHCRVLHAYFVSRHQSVMRRHIVSAGISNCLVASGKRPAGIA